MTASAEKFPPEVRERAVRMVFEHRDEHESRGASIGSIVAKIGCTAETLRGWVRQHERDAGLREGLTSADKERIKTLERENRELRQANEILRKMSAYFTQELDRPERLRHAMLLRVFFSVRSECQLTEQARYNLPHRWLIGLAIDDEVWEHSTFSKNRLVRRQ